MSGNRDEKVDEERKIKQVYRERNTTTDRVDFIYKDKIDSEEYLLGKRVDTHFENQNLPQINESAIGAKFDEDPAAHNERIISEIKQREDPLSAIRKKEEDARKALLNNPMKMKQLERALKENRAKRRSKDGDELLARYMAIKGEKLSEPKKPKKRKLPDDDKSLLRRYLELIGKARRKRFYSDSSEDGEEDKYYKNSREPKAHSPASPQRSGREENNWQGNETVRRHAGSNLGQRADGSRGRDKSKEEGYRQQRHGEEKRLQRNERGDDRSDYKRRDTKENRNHRGRSGSVERNQREKRYNDEKNGDGYFNKRRSSRDRDGAHYIDSRDKGRNFNSPEVKVRNKALSGSRDRSSKKRNDSRDKEPNSRGRTRSRERDDDRQAQSKDRGQIDIKNGAKDKENKGCVDRRGNETRGRRDSRDRETKGHRDGRDREAWGRRDSRGRGHRDSRGRETRGRRDSQHRETRSRSDSRDRGRLGRRENRDSKTRTHRDSRDRDTRERKHDRDRETRGHRDERGRDISVRRGSTDRVAGKSNRDEMRKNHDRIKNESFSDEDQSQRNAKQSSHVGHHRRKRRRSYSSSSSSSRSSERNQSRQRSAKVKREVRSRHDRRSSSEGERGRRRDKEERVKKRSSSKRNVSSSSSSSGSSGSSTDSSSGSESDSSADRKPNKRKLIGPSLQAPAERSEKRDHSSEDEGKDAMRHRVKEERETSEERRPKLAAYGLVHPKGDNALETKAKEDSKRKDESEKNKDKQLSPTSSSSSQPLSKPKKELTAEEKEARLKEMMDNANWRDEQRKRNVERYEEEQRKEDEEYAKNHGKNDDFIAPMMTKHAGESSIEDQLKRNRKKIQRGSSGTEKSFARK